MGEPLQPPVSWARPWLLRDGGSRLCLGQAALSEDVVPELDVLRMMLENNVKAVAWAVTKEPKQ